MANRRPRNDPEERDDDKGVGIEQDEHLLNPDRFIVPGRDDQGFSVKIQFNASPQLVRELQVILNSKAFPYETVGDILRHAALRHFRYLHYCEPYMLRHFLSVLDATMDEIRDATILTRGQKVMENLKAKIHEDMEKGEVETAMRVLAFVKTYVRDLPESKWKSQFQTEFVQAFAKYLE